MTFRLTRRAWIRTIIYSGLAITSGVGYVSSKRLEMVYADVPLAGLPKGLDGIKIGVMADFHAGAFTTKKDILQAINNINKERPDLIVLLGDYVDGAYSHSRKNVEKGSYVFDALQRLKAPLVPIQSIRASGLQTNSATAVFRYPKLFQCYLLMNHLL